MKNLNNNTDKEMMQSETLEQMREQLGILKQKLDKQTIVTDKLIQQSMKQKMSWIQKYCWFQILVLFPFVSIYFAIFKEHFGFSWLSYFALVGLMAISCISDFIINKMKPEDWESDNLIQTVKKLLRMKRIRKLNELAMIPCAIVVLSFLAYDCYTAGKLEYGEMVSCGIGALIGLIIGGCIGIRIVIKMQHTNDEVIKQIEELTNSQEQESGNECLQ